MLLTLLRYRIRMALNTVRYASRRDRVVACFLIVTTLALGVFVFSGFYVAFVLRGVPGTDVLSHELALSLFLFMLAGSIPFVSATLLHPGDLDLIGTTPVPVRSVVVVRLIEGAIASTAQFVPIGLPAIAALLVASNVSLLRVPLALLPCLLLVLLPPAVSGTLLLGAARLLGLTRVRAATTIVNLLLGTLVCFVVVRQVTGLQGQAEGMVAAWSQSCTSGSLAFLPPWSWIGSALSSIPSGQLARFAENTSMGALVTMLLWMLAARMGEATFTSGVLGSSERRSAAGRTGRGMAGTAPRRLAPKRMTVSKEILCMMRDSLLLSQIGMPAILFIVPFALAGTPVLGSLGRGDEMFVFSFAMIVAAQYMQASILSLSSVGLEGRAGWVLFVSPNHFLRLLARKWLASWILCSGLASLMALAAGVVFRADGYVVGLGVLLLSASGAGLCGIGTGVGAALPRFAFENPAHRVGPAAMVVSFGLSILYSLTIWGTVAAAWWASVNWEEYAGVITATAALVLMMVTLVAVAIPLAIGAARLENLEWRF